MRATSEGPSRAALACRFACCLACRRPSPSRALAGDILCFDNRRVLHGRSGFELASGETRKLIGTYLRWDEIRSLARVKAASVFSDRLL